jgi:hypothetical protein
MSSLVFTSINVHIPRLLERRADSRRCLALQGKLPTPPIIATLGISLVDASEGRCVFEGSPAEWQYNHLGTVHGGWLSALLDCALGWRLAGRAFQAYAERRRRQRDASARRTLADFVIGAHALANGCRLLTLDDRLYRSSFPTPAIETFYVTRKTTHN